VPVHGEPQHLAAHAELARELGVPTVIEALNGMVVRLAPDPAGQIGEVDTGRLYKDGRIIGDFDSIGVAERRRLSFSGHVVVALTIDRKGETLADPELRLTGLPIRDAAGRPLEETVLNAVTGTLDSLPRPQRRDPDVVGEAVRRAVRAAVADAWGKKPVCTILVSVV